MRVTPAGLPRNVGIILGLGGGHGGIRVRRLWEAKGPGVDRHGGLGLVKYHNEKVTGQERRRNVECGGGQSNTSLSQTAVGMLAHGRGDSPCNKRDYGMGWFRYVRVPVTGMCGSAGGCLNGAGRFVWEGGCFCVIRLTRGEYFGG